MNIVVAPTKVPANVSRTNVDFEIFLIRQIELMRILYL
jgi:hypothetical protein